MTTLPAHVPAGPRVIVALDFPGADAALEMARRLDPTRCRVKVGKELFTSGGPLLVARLRALGYEVFVISSSTTFRTRWRRPAGPRRATGPG